MSAKDPSTERARRPRHKRHASSSGTRTSSSSSVRIAQAPFVVGWREWVVLSELAPASIKAKVDTGARTSALHAENVTIVRRKGGKQVVRFTVLPTQRTTARLFEATAALVGTRRVRSSSGHLEMRPVISTSLAINGRSWPIELTLTDRDHMGFRMLLGREAMRRRLIVDPSRSYVVGAKPAKPHPSTTSS